MLPQGMELEDAGTWSALRFHPELLALLKLQWAVPKVGKAGVWRVLVAGEPCHAMWGRGVAYGVLEHHLLAPSPRRNPCGFKGRWPWPDCRGGIAESREGCKQLEEPHSLLWDSKGIRKKGKQDKAFSYCCSQSEQWGRSHPHS